MENLYYNPETYGLTIVEQCDTGEDYGFDLTVIFRKDNNYYLGTDSGCSCPTPFESYTFEDLTGPLTKEQAYEEYNSLIGENMRKL